MSSTLLCIYLIPTNMKTCRKAINNTSLKWSPKGVVIVIPVWVNELISETCYWGTAWYRLLVHPHPPPPLPALSGGPDAKKGNEDTAPSVLYVARLELYSRGAGSGPTVGEPCNIPGQQQRDAQYETGKVKCGNHISCAFEIRRILVTHWIIHENAHLKSQCGHKVCFFTTWENLK